MSIKSQSLNALEQLFALIDRLDDKQYVQPLILLHGNTIGKHARHIIEFHQCLFTDDRNSIVCYDKRIRSKELEEERLSALSIIQLLRNKVMQAEDRELLLESIFEDKVSYLKSSLYRELSYNIEHSIHHLAIIRIGIEATFPDFKVEDNLGVAYSTQQYKAESIKN